MWKVGLFSGVVLFSVCELPLPADWSQYIQGGALAILAAAVAGLFRELAEQRKGAKSERDAHAKTLDKLCDRWDGWEKTRHSDHETLNETLTGLRVHCAGKRQNNEE